MSTQPTGSPFSAVPLPRSRAWLALIFAAAAFLSLGGMLEYGAGSPMTQGQGVASYWLAFFGFHAAAFGGAALLGAFPALTARVAKAVWLGAVVAAYVTAFLIWRASQNEAQAASALAWLSHWRGYAPALLPLLCGLLWGAADESQVR
jgi:ABC-type spermidine/putrescine transport system permease subunit I